LKNRVAILFILCLLQVVLVTSPVIAATEKGPRCSDFIDNDGDSLIDGDDPDCIKGKGGQAAYSFKLIAETGSQFTFLSSPAMNNQGDVVFRAGLPGSREGLFVGGKGKVKELFSAPQSLSNPSINDQRQVAFDSAGGVFLLADNATKQVISGSEYAYPSLNNNGDVAFVRIVNSSQLLVGNGEGPALVLYDNTGVFSGGLTAPTLNDFGAVAFVAGLGNGQQGVFLGDGTSTTNIAETDGSFAGFGGTIPDVNNDGLVAFFAFQSTGEQGVFTGDGNSTMTFVDSQGPYQEFRFPNVNAAGAVLFEAILDGQSSRGLYVGPDPSTDKVVAPGDQLFDSMVVNAFGAGDQALNDRGEVVFYAVLADGRGVIVKAKPR